MCFTTFYTENGIIDFQALNMKTMLEMSTGTLTEAKKKKSVLLSPCQSKQI